MSSPDVSIVIPVRNEESSIGPALDDLASYFHAAGLRCELIVVDDGSVDGTRAVVDARREADHTIRLVSLEQGRGKGAAVRRGMREARGEVTAFTEGDVAYPLQRLGDAIAMVQSSWTDIAIGGRDLVRQGSGSTSSGVRRVVDSAASLLARLTLSRMPPDARCGMKAFSRRAATLLFAESKIDGDGFDFEILYLANLYGFRVERVPVEMSRRRTSRARLAHPSLRLFSDVVNVRFLASDNAYRAPRRCPVCFSAEVRSLTQIGRYLVRECVGCRCRYLGEFPAEDDVESTRGTAGSAATRSQDRASGPAADKTDARRLAQMRKVLGPRARVLEVEAGAGTFSEAAAKEFEYVGINRSSDAARSARAKGLDVLQCSSLEQFVNTGSPFDAIEMDGVLEGLPDPHVALSTAARLLRPRGFVFLGVLDTESLACTLAGNRWSGYRFPERLILFSRSALIELLEQEGFDVVSVTGELEYRDRDDLVARLQAAGPLSSRLGRIALALLPDPLPVPSSSIRIVARRRSGPPLRFETARTPEPTHAR